jgi:hypothetical protein
MVYGNQKFQRINESRKAIKSPLYISFYLYIYILIYSISSYAAMLLLLLCMKESLKKSFSIKIYCLKVLNLCMCGGPIWTCFLARVLGS